MLFLDDPNAVTTTVNSGGPKPLLIGHHQDGDCVSLPGGQLLRRAPTSFLSHFGVMLMVHPT